MCFTGKCKAGGGNPVERARIDILPCFSPRRGEQFHPATSGCNRAATRSTFSARKRSMATQPISGRALGHYRLIERIGEGGMGIVYRAYDEHLQREIAVKLLPASVVRDESARRRFRKDALTLAHLNHPNI